MQKNNKRSAAHSLFCVGISVFLLGVTRLNTYIAKNYKERFFSVYTDFSKKAVGFFARLTSFTPFDLWEIIALLLIVLTAVNFARKFKRGQAALRPAQALLCVCTLVFIFVNIWGLNYYAPSMASRLGLTECQYTPSQLCEMTVYFRDKASEYADKIQRDENGLAAVDFEKMSFQAGDCFEKLAKEYPVFDGSTDRVKKLITGRLFTKRGTTGIFVCITGESNVSEYVYSRSMPLTMCHEIGHRMAFAREDEANFAGYLACEISDDVQFVYSGYYHAFIWCFNALYKVNPEAATEIIQNRGDSLKFDIVSSSEHYNRIENKKAVEISDGIYEKYLQSFDVSEGMQSYGMVVDLLAMYYFQRLK